MEVFVLIVKYYFLMVFLTSVVAAWLFMDVNDVVDNPQGIFEDAFIGIVVGFLWPVTIPFFIFHKVGSVCQRLFTAES